MLVDTQPATLQHAPASPEVRDEWIDSQLIGVLMDNAAMSMAASLLSLPLLLIVLAGEVDVLWLSAWTLVAVVALGVRYKLVDVYRLRYDSVGGTGRRDYVQRYRWTWLFAGLMWALPISLTYLQSSLQAQFVTGFALLAYGLISLTALSAWLPAFRAYVSGLTLSALSSLVAIQLTLPYAQGYLLLTVVLACLLIVFWGLLQVAGERLNRVYRSSFDLQFSNQELIDSLTRQTQASLRAVATKNRFLASAAHDLRQPVHALSLYADWLATEPEMAREISPRILQSTRAINELFDSLFDLTRIDAGNYKVRLQNVDVRQLFADLCLQYEPIAAGKSLKLRAHARPTTIWADPVVLRRILGNLLSNAVKHTQKGGIMLALRHRPDMVVFEVWDTGVGIAREHQQAIFQEFFRVSQHQGTEDSLGLGLTIVSKLATLMGYQLALKSEPGRGSVFRVMLPAFTQQRVDEHMVMPNVLLSSQLMELR